MNPKLWRQLSKWHYVASLLFGIQVLIWVGTGLYFAAVPIETIRGEHLKAAPKPEMIDIKDLVSPEIAAASVLDGAVEITLKTINNQPTYLLTDQKGARTRIDARTGMVLGPVSAVEARQIAAQVYKGKGEIKDVRYYQTPPKEYARPGPVYGIEFGPKDEAVLYVDAVNADAKVVRTPQWRFYDFLWGLHIMDWVDRENFNTWHLMVFALGALFLSLMGISLMGARTWRNRLSRKQVGV